MAETRPPKSRPWILHEGEESFRVDTASGTHLAYFYYENEPGRRAVTHRMTREEARRLALEFQRLPELIDELRRHRAAREDPA